MPSERVQRRIDDLLDQAEQAVSGRDWVAVRELADAVLAVDLDNNDATSFKAMADRAAPAPEVNIASAEVADADSRHETQIEHAPTSFANGRYEVKHLLGEGGKKMVYLVHDTTLDRDVAFGLIKAEGLDDASRQRISREAQMMGRLGTHPNIVTVFDLGTEGDEPYMVTELMGGGDVEALLTVSPDSFSPASEVLPTTELARDALPSSGERLDAASNQAFSPRLPLDRAIEIARAVCEGLVFAHSVGIVHRDLKPGNIWLTDDGTAKIGDFGLAMNTDQSRLTREGMIVGTVHYMSPEQAIGGEITPRTDLYSLGAMLYEMVTGRPPFMGDDSIGIISQHVNTPPVAPSWHNQSLPRTLDSLIMRLLAKDPAERPESAQALLQALDSIDPTEPAEAHEGEQGSLDSMSGGVFVGRQREMDALKAAFEETLGGHGKMVALVGEPGIGKTRTAQELATYASMRGGQVLWGRCYEGGGAPSYWTWIQTIRSYVMDRDAETIRREMGSAASVIAEIVPDVKDRLPDLHPPSQIDDPDSARFRLFDSITTFLKSASSAQPIILMLEDLHWSDTPSLTLLEFLAPELRNSRVMIVANYRDMELNRRHPLSVTLGELSREHLFDRVLLRGLQKHDVRRFIEVAAGIDPPDALVNAVHTQTEGNPLFVTETVRFLIQEGDIASGVMAEGGTSSWNIRIPEGVREVIGRRLDRLSERCNEVLTIAAVIGRQFRFGVLMKLAEEASENTLLDVLDEALDGRIVEETRSEVGLYQFTHALMQETLTSELSLNRQVRLHARIAEALEAHYGIDAEDHAPELVGHFSEAQTILGSDKLIHYAIAAGHQAVEAIAPASAAEYFQVGIDAFGDEQPDARLAEMLGGLGRAQVFTLERQEFQSAIDNLTRAFDLHVENGNLDAALPLASTPTFHIRGPTGMAALQERALSLVVKGSIEEGRILAEYGLWVSLERADYAVALDAFERALAISTSSQDHFLEFRVHSNATPVHTFFLQSDQRLTSGLKAIELAHKLDLPIGVDAHFHVGMEYLRRGDVAAARSHAEMGEPLAERLNNTFLWGTAMNLSAAVELVTGNWDAARNFIEKGLEKSPTERRLISQLSILDITLGNSHGAPNNHESQNLFDAAWALLWGAPIATTEEFEEGAWMELKSPTLEPGFKVNALRGLGMTAVARGSSALATRVYESPLISVISSFGVASRLTSPWLIGTIANLAGDHEIAEGHFGDAIDFCRNAGYKPDLAMSCAFFSEMLLERNSPGDREKAIELQNEAIAIATDLGMKPLLERVLAQREILKA